MRPTFVPVFFDLSLLTQPPKTVSLFPRTSNAIALALPTRIDVTTPPDATSNTVTVVGAIHVQPLPFGCVELSFCAKIECATEKPRNITKLAATVGLLPSGPSLASITPFDPHAQPSPIFSSKSADIVLDDLLSLVTLLHTRFARYPAVDAAHHSHFITVTIPRAPPLSGAEDAVMTTTIDAAQQQTWRRIANTVKNPVATFVASVDAPPGGVDSKQEKSAWGKAQTHVDVSADAAIAYLWAVNSYDRAAENAGKTLRANFDVPDSHSKLYARVVKFTGITNRLFSTWFVWDRNPADGSYILAFKPVEEKGSSIAEVHLKKIEESMTKDTAAVNAVRATTRGYWRVRPLAENICEITLVQQADLKGYLPVVIFNTRILSALNALRDIRHKFLRNGKIVDAEAHAAFPAPPPLSHLSPDQLAMLATCRELEKSVGYKTSRSLMTDGWVPHKAPSPFVSAYSKYAPLAPGSRPVVLSKGAVVVDCSALTALAWFFDFDGRERRGFGHDRGDLARITHARYSAHDNIIATVWKTPFFLHNRELVFRQLCATEPDGVSFVHALRSVDIDADYGFGRSSSLVSGNGTALVTVEPLSSRQCTFTIIQHISVGGYVPSWWSRKALARNLKITDILRGAFQRDAAADREDFAELAATLRRRNKPDQASQDIVESVRGKLSDLGDFEELESPDHFVKMEAVDSNKLRASTVIDAAIEEIAPWEMSQMSRENMKEHHNFGGLERDLLKVNEHRSIYRVVYDLGIPGVRPREWCQSQVWSWADENNLEVCYADVDDPRFPIDNKYSRASSCLLWRYETLSPICGIPQTRLTYTQEVSLGGKIPRWVLAMQKKQRVSMLSYLSTCR